MNVDIEVYLSGIIKFFKDNPKDLLSLVPKDKEDDFYLMLRKYSCDNHEKGEDYILTRNQILEICIQLNDPKKVLQDAKLIKSKKKGIVLIKIIIFFGKYTTICKGTFFLV